MPTPWASRRRRAPISGASSLMGRFLARRLFFCAVLVVMTASTALLLTRVAPGDLTTSLPPFATTREIAAERARFALDRPFAVQWGTWAASAMRFDFGESSRYRRPVGPLVLQA